MIKGTEMVLHKGIDGKMYKLRLKVPYNFDLELIDRVKELKDKHPDIEYFFYLPCDPKDCYTTKRKPGLIVPSDDEYLKHISYLNKKDFDFEVLFQQPGLILSDEVLKKYIDLDAKRFTFYEDQNAIRIKELVPSAYTAASITKVFRPEEIKNRNLSMYDEICLFFWYNRNLDVIEQLPKKFEYSIIPNTGCKVNCSMHLIHWFNSKLLFDSISKSCIYTDESLSSCVSLEDYINWFSKYISILKLVDRSSPSDEIIDSLVYYSGGSLDLIKKCSFLEKLLRGHSRDYYNIKSSFPFSITEARFKELLEIAQKDNI